MQPDVEVGSMIAAGPGAVEALAAEAKNDDPFCKFKSGKGNAPAQDGDDGSTATVDESGDNGTANSTTEPAAADAADAARVAQYQADEEAEKAAFQAYVFICSVDHIMFNAKSLT
jgi:hypothetical protein